MCKYYTTCFPESTPIPIFLDPFSLSLNSITETHPSSSFIINTSSSTTHTLTDVESTPPHPSELPLFIPTEEPNIPISAPLRDLSQQFQQLQVRKRQFSNEDEPSEIRKKLRQSEIPSSSQEDGSNQTESPISTLHFDNPLDVCLPIPDLRPSPPTRRRRPRTHPINPRVRGRGRRGGRRSGGRHTATAITSLLTTQVSSSIGVTENLFEVQIQVQESIHVVQSDVSDSEDAAVPQDALPQDTTNIPQQSEQGYGSWPDAATELP